MQPTHEQPTQIWGLIIGLALGIVWAWLGLGAALLAGALGAIGWLAGTAIGDAATGTSNLTNLWHDLQSRRRTEP